MVLLRNVFIASLAILGADAVSAVIDLIPSNFDDVVLKSGNPSLVEFFAPWCGRKYLLAISMRSSLKLLFNSDLASASLRPNNTDLPIIDCKNLAPIYEELAQNFQHAESKLNIAKLDADEHKELARKFGIQGFPTLKWFDGKNKEPQEYNLGRDLDSLTSFITEQTGIKPKTDKAPSHVRILKDSTFNNTIGGEEHVLVAFTAPWCGRKDQSSLSLTYDVDVEAESSTPWEYCGRNVHSQ